MPNFLSDGSIIPQAFAVHRKKSALSKKRNNFSMVKARVDEVIYIDDDRNSTKDTSNPQVEYVCTVLGGTEVGRKLFNVKSVTPLGSGSFFNFGEVIHTPRLENSPGDNDGTTTNTPEKTTGSFVIISRLHGYDEGPVIIGNLKHSDSPGATKEDGQRINWEFAGIKIEITKDGAFSLTFGGGPKDYQGKPADEQAAGASVQISKDGVMKFTDGDGDDITIDKTNKKITIDTQENLEINTGQDWSINVTGNVNLTAEGEVNIDGSIVNIAGGGFQAARANDIVLGQDSRGGAINAYIGFGSSTVFIGG